ncbi:MAG: DUF1501 domain-containing protein [Erythrobacter sp.]|nr:MAG: DUF1501 domain-containing protein [Erythrobacter sp.]
MARTHSLPITRRRLLAGTLASSALLGTSAVPLSIARAATGRRKFVFVIQRGAADGLAIVQPHGDRNLRDLRGALVDDDALRLDGFFALHPALAGTAGLFHSGEARAWHAVATNYRERSHFEAQNVLETGGERAYAVNTGWLGRMMPLLPEGTGAMAVSATAPMALRGSVPVATYTPNRLPDPNEDLLARLAIMYAEDAQLGPMWDEAMRTRMVTGGLGNTAAGGGADLGQLAATLLAGEGGADVLMIETGGWDTHRAQQRALAGQLSAMDSLLVALRQGLGAAWADTLVLVATEFGRTAAINGTMGTDHGTASAALLLGGSLPAGEMVESDWPGLSRNQLYDGRDLRPTGDLLSMATRAFAAHFGLERDRALAALSAGQ